MDYLDLNPRQQAWVDETLASLTLDEKIGQLVCHHSGYIKEPDKVADWLKDYPVGSFYVGSEIIEVGATPKDKIQRFLSRTMGATKVPIVNSGDFEHGIGRTITGFSKLPELMGLGATFSPELAYEYGKILAVEGRAFNLKWSFAPVADLALNRENPLANIRCMSDDTGHAAKMLCSQIRGMQDHGMACCFKHFPGDGTDTRNQHLVTSLNLLSKEEWDRTEGRVFKSLVDAGALSVMIGHLGFPAYEPKNAEKDKFRPATASRRILTDLLRGELGFKGLILTDALCMAGYKVWASYEERILESLEAGVDMFLWPEPEKFFPLVRAALKDGRASMRRVDESARRVLEFKARLGLHEGVPPLRDLAAETLAAHKETGQKIADHSVTLLRNRKSILPLKIPAKSKILVIAATEKEMALKPLDFFKEELERRGHEVTFEKLSDFHKYREGVSKFDLAFLVCNTRPLYHHHRCADWAIWPMIECEDIKKLVVISFGTPYFLYDVDSVDTYVNAYSDGDNSQLAAIKAMFGEINFEGRSPVGVEHCFKFGDGLKI